MIPRQAERHVTRHGNDGVDRYVEPGRAIGGLHTLVAIPGDHVGARVQGVVDHALNVSHADKVPRLQVHAVARLEVHRHISVEVRTERRTIREAEVAVDPECRPDADETVVGQERGVEGLDVGADVPVELARVRRVDVVRESLSVKEPVRIRPKGGEEHPRIRRSGVHKPSRVGGGEHRKLSGGRRRI
jgi:hypothetical protein